MSSRSSALNPRSPVWAKPRLTQVLSAAVAAAQLLLAACGGLKMPASHPPLTAYQAEAAPIDVGAARVDITPPPGLSLFGHGPGSGVAVGYWTRLYCRAFYFRSAPALREGLAVVSCDLPQISTLLQRRTAAAVCPPFPAARLMLSATHTHAGPGHFFESTNLGGMGSAHFPGYDDAVVEFLAERIARAIELARDRAEPARLRWLRDDTVWGITRNRSLEPFLANSPLFRAPSQPTPTLRLTGDEKAIDPTLRVLQIESLAETSAPIGALAFFAMHPTVLANTNRYINGDVFGVATRALEQAAYRAWIGKIAEQDLKARSTGDPRHADQAPRVQACRLTDYAPLSCRDLPRAEPVVALFNTNEGDVSPIRKTGTSAEAVQRGLELARRMGDLLRNADQPETQVPWLERALLDVRYIEADLPGAPIAPGPGVPRDGLCPKAELGFASSLGGTDHPSLFQSLLSVNESPRDVERKDCQAPKRPFLGAIQNFVGGSFPTHVPLAQLRIENTWLAFVPAELTVTAGARLNEAVKRAAPSVRSDSVVVGLANGYIMYVTTPEEYEFQNYEGASTIYGPATAPWLAQTFAMLARHMNGDRSVERWLHPLTRGRINEATAFSYETAPKNERLWRSEWDTPIAKMQTQRRPLAVCSVPGHETPTLCFYWVDAGPSQVALASEPWLEFVHAETGSPVYTCGRLDLEPLAQEGGCDGVSTIDDRGTNFFTRIHERRGDGFVWSTLVRFSKAQVEALAVPLRIRVRAPAGFAPIDSPPLSPRCSTCTLEQLASYCGELP